MLLEDCLIGGWKSQSYLSKNKRGLLTGGKENNPWERMNIGEKRMGVTFDNQKGQSKRKTNKKKRGSYRIENTGKLFHDRPVIVLKPGPGEVGKKLETKSDQSKKEAGRS